MTESCLLSNELEPMYATFCTQSAEEFAAHYETFHGCCSAKMCGNGEVRSVASLSTQVIDQLRLEYSKFDFGLKGTLMGNTQHYGVRVPLVDGSNNLGRQDRQSAGSGEIAVFSAHKGLETSTKPGHAALNLALPNSFLTSFAMSLYQNECNQPLELDARIRLGDMQRTMLKSLFDHLIAFVVLSPNSLKNPLVVACIEEHVARVLLCVVPHKYAKRDLVSGSEETPRILKSAEDYMRQFAGEPLTLSRICKHAGCSLRALQSAFRQFRDTTPIAALHEIRLEGARHDLMNDLAPVTLIAHKWGFSNPGRFSESYRAKYGEYPSETGQAKIHSPQNA